MSPSLTNSPFFLIYVKHTEDSRKYYRNICRNLHVMFPINVLIFFYNPPISTLTSFWPLYCTLGFLAYGLTNVVKNMFLRVVPTSFLLCVLCVVNTGGLLWFVAEALLVLPLGPPGLIHSPFPFPFFFRLSRWRRKLHPRGRHEGLGGASDGSLRSDKNPGRVFKSILFFIQRRSSNHNYIVILFVKVVTLQVCVKNVFEKKETYL